MPGIQRFNVNRMLVGQAVQLDDSYSPGSNYEIGGDPSYPTLVWQCWANNDDTIDHVLTFTFVSSYRAWDVLVPAGAGVGATPPIDCLAPLYTSALFEGVFLAGNHSLLFSLQAAPNAGKTVNVWALAGAIVG